MIHSKAQRHAQTFLEALKPCCQQISIAGSIRRQMAEVKDIEIVAVPIFIEEEQEDLFGPTGKTKRINELETNLNKAMGATGWRLGKINGPKYKQLIAIGQNLKLDLFIFSAARQWGAGLVLRTGPADFNVRLMRYILSRNMHVDGNLLHGHGRAYKDQKAIKCDKGDICSLIIPTPTEADFFTALELPFPAPQDRTVQWIRSIIKARIRNKAFV